MCPISIFEVTPSKHFFSKVFSFNPKIFVDSSKKILLFFIVISNFFFFFWEITPILPILLSLLQDTLGTKIDINPDYTFTEIGGNSLTGAALISLAKQRDLDLDIEALLQCDFTLQYIFYALMSTFSVHGEKNFFFQYPECTVFLQ